MDSVATQSLKKELWDLLQFSGPIQVVKALAPSSAIAGSGNTESLVLMAKEILGKFQRVIAAAGKKL
jgi:hypothetical protein